MARISKSVSCEIEYFMNCEFKKKIYAALMMKYMQEEHL